MAVVVFNYEMWVTRYPEFAYISSGTAQLYFNEAQLYCDNSSVSIIQDGSPGGYRNMLLNMMTAHIAALNSPTAAGQPASPLVGRINVATEGSVTANAQNDYPTGSVQWYQQTKYGSAFWSAIKQFKLGGLYVRGCVNNVYSPPFPTIPPV